MNPPFDIPDSISTMIGYVQPFLNPEQVDFPTTLIKSVIFYQEGEASVCNCTSSIFPGPRYTCNKKLALRLGSFGSPLSTWPAVPL